MAQKENRLQDSNKEDQASTEPHRNWIPRSSTLLNYYFARAPGALVSSIFQLALFDLHVFELARFEDFAAFQAFDKLGIFLASYDADTGVLARLHGVFLLGWFRRAGYGHRFRFNCPGRTPRERIAAGIGRIFSGKKVVVKQRMDNAVGAATSSPRAAFSAVTCA
jgi:hypothetical protein